MVSFTIGSFSGTDGGGGSGERGIDVSLLYGVGGLTAMDEVDRGEQVEESA